MHEEITKKDRKWHSIVTISGSLRKRSFNTALMRSLPALAPAARDLSEAPPYDRMPLYNADIQSVGFPADVITFADAIRNADGVIIVSPEYNWTIPGGLKNALDWVLRLENQPFRDKPVAIQSATGGPLGGARMQYHLWMALTFLNATIFGMPEVFVGLAQTKFEGGVLKDEPTKRWSPTGSRRSPNSLHAPRPRPARVA
jgi:chromate reductase, NAD(P)H dehydrogenase (quinone)